MSIPKMKFMNNIAPIIFNGFSWCYITQVIYYYNIVPTIYFSSVLYYARVDIFLGAILPKMEKGANICSPHFTTLSVKLGSVFAPKTSFHIIIKIYSDASGVDAIPFGISIITLENVALC